MKPYQILEVANTHGGNIDYLLSLIDEFSELKGFGIKFQPLHPDKIATPDFSWYKVYQKLFFQQKEWTQIIKKASETKEIWLDLFDIYGVKIFSQHKNLIKGIKLQSSILYNETVISELEQVKLENHILIINVSGLEIDPIYERIQIFKERLKPIEIWIEVGFQAYPTELQDCGYVKIQVIKKEFSTKVVFADHSDGRSYEAIWIPIVAAMNGVDVIEKHICHSKMKTKYDYYSSINKVKYLQYIDKLTSYLSLKDKPFINERERIYFTNSIQIPVCRKKIAAGNLLNFKTDFDYKRTGSPGLNVLELKELQRDLHILSRNLNSGNTFKREDFKKANIATIIACRLKSSRLPRKALLKIGELTSVERCIQSCLNFKNVNHTILATSDLEEDDDLKDYTYAPSVIFYKGDPEDVIRRYLGVIEDLKIDIIIRITADMPFVSHDIVDILLQSHFKTGADYTAAKHFAVGSSVEIINSTALKKIKNHFPNANYSEYMTWYFQNNPDHFNLNFVELPASLIRDYRLTLDYKEDLEMFNKVQMHLDEIRSNASIKKIFEYLDLNPNVAKINAHLTLKYKTDKTLIETLNKATKI